MQKYLRMAVLGIFLAGTPAQGLEMMDGVPCYRSQSSVCIDYVLFSPPDTNGRQEARITLTREWTADRYHISLRKKDSVTEAFADLKSVLPCATLDVFLQQNHLKGNQLIPEKLRSLTYTINVPS